MLTLFLAVCLFSVACMQIDIQLQQCGQVFVVAIKRSGKSASWAVQYARLCSHLKAAAQPLRLDDTVQDALYGRCYGTPLLEADPL